MQRIEYLVNYDTLYSSCLKAAKDVGFNIETELSSDGLIKMSTGLSLRSWGEVIEVKITDLSSNKSIVEIVSKPKTQIFDWGKGSENENLFLSSLNKILGVLK